MTPNKLSKRLNRAMSRSKKNLEPISKMHERMQGVMIQYKYEQIKKLLEHAEKVKK